MLKSGTKCLFALNQLIYHSYLSPHIQGSKEEGDNFASTQEPEPKVSGGKERTMEVTNIHSCGCLNVMAPISS